jgi:CheY-like chemotaxis protein
MANNGRILIIEDEKSMREVLRILLEEEGYEITAASNGIEGMEYLSGDIFDLVVTDIKMPKADGFEVLKRLGTLSFNNRVSWPSERPNLQLKHEAGSIRLHPQTFQDR